MRIGLPPLDTGLPSRPLEEVLASSKLERGNSDGPFVVIAPIHFGFLKDPPEPTYDGSVIVDPETGSGRLVPAPKEND